MFKKIFISLILCMSLFSVVAFADSAPDGNNYTYFCLYSESSSNFKIYFNDYRINGDVINFPSGAVRVSVDSGTYSNVSLIDLSHWSDPTLKQTNVQEIYDVWIRRDDNASVVVPPVIAPTAMEAIQGIVPQLSKQLKILLPVGVILLSTILGVSLVPRLVRSFL